MLIIDDTISSRACTCRWCKCIEGSLRLSNTTAAGPSAYNVSQGVGQKACLSNQRSVQSAKMGTNGRFGAKENMRRDSLPGPGQYGSPNVLVMSHHCCLPKVGFPRANRDANKKVLHFLCPRHPFRFWCALHSFKQPNFGFQPDLGFLSSFLLNDNLSCIPSSLQNYLLCR